MNLTMPATRRTAFVPLAMLTSHREGIILPRRAGCDPTGAVIRIRSRRDSPGPSCLGAGLAGLDPACSRDLGEALPPGASSARSDMPACPCHTPLRGLRDDNNDASGSDAERANGDWGYAASGVSDRIFA